MYEGVPSSVGSLYVVHRGGLYHINSMGFVRFQDVKQGMHVHDHHFFKTHDVNHTLLYAVLYHSVKVRFGSQSGPSAPPPVSIL